MAAMDRALVRAVAVIQAVHDAGAAGIGQKFTVITNQAARGGQEGDARAANAKGTQIGHLALACRHFFDHDACEFIIHVDGNFLDRFGALTAIRILAVQHPWPADSQLEAFPTHSLYQNAQLQFAPARHFEGILVAGLGNFDGDIPLGLGHQAGADHPALHFRAVAPGHGRVIDGKGHGQGRRVNRWRHDRLGYHGIGEGVGNGGVLQAGDGNNIAGRNRLHRNTVQATKGQQLSHPGSFHHTAVIAQRADGIVLRQTPSLDTACQNPAQIGIGVQQGRDHGKGRIRIDRRGGHMSVQ